MAQRKAKDAAADPNEVAASNQNLEGTGEENIEEATGGDTIPEEAPNDASEPEKKTKKSGKSKTETGSKAKSEDIPADVLKVLKNFPTEEELYVSKFGGVFAKDTNPSFVSGAILYKNPFYKS